MSTLRMPTVNQVALTGRLVQDPELNRTETGTARLALRLAVNRPYRDRQGTWQEETAFISLVAWHKLAEFGAERLHKGSPVFVSGRLTSYSWTDDEGQPKSRVEVQVRSLQLLERQTSTAEVDLPIEADGAPETEIELASEEPELEIA